MATSSSKFPNKPPGRLAALTKRKELASHIMQRLGKANPDAHCELYYENPYQLLISVVMSAQTTDKMVNRCMEPLYRDGLNIDQVLKWGEKGLLQRIRSIGLAPTKAKNVVRLSQILRELHQDQVPDSREALEALPGVGRKTANVILGEIFGHPTLAVDTHVFRVGSRLGLHRESSPEKAELELLKVIAPESLPQGHHWLILHGRYTCRAQRPLCSECVLSDLCLLA